MNVRLTALNIAKGLLRESPDYKPESVEDFTYDAMVLAESLMEWAETGDEHSVICYFAAAETMKNMMN